MNLLLLSSISEVLSDDDDPILLERERKEAFFSKKFYKALKDYFIFCGVIFNILMGTFAVMLLLMYRW